MARTALGLALALSLPLAAGASAQQTASATLIDPEGTQIGTAELIETPSYGVLIRIEVEGLEPGIHSFHIHETGRCSTPDFDSAGGHFAPRGRSHGLLHPHGKHAGDLANLHVPETGRVETERLAQHVTLLEGATASLMDEDGSALVIHATADDYESQPAGGGGPKVACGVIR